MIKNINKHQKEYLKYIVEINMINSPNNVYISSCINNKVHPFVPYFNGGCYRMDSQENFIDFFLKKEIFRIRDVHNRFLSLQEFKVQLSLGTLPACYVVLDPKVLDGARIILEKYTCNLLKNKGKNDKERT